MNNLNPKVILAAAAVAILGLLVALYVEVSPFTEIGAAAVIGGIVLIFVQVRRSRA